MDYLPESTRLLYTQLLTQCLHGAAPSGRGLSFVSKQIRGGKHWYLQRTVGSRKTQHYLGPDSEDLRALMAKEKTLWESAATDFAARANLASMLISGGAYAANSIDARVLRCLSVRAFFLRAACWSVRTPSPSTATCSA